METIKYKNFKIKIEQDEYPENPMNWDGNAMFCLHHNRYNLQNDTDFVSSDFTGWEGMKTGIIKKYKPLAILPVYMYDHSGITINTTCFSCRWDSGMIGFTFIDLPTLKKWGFNAKDKTKLELEKDIISNVALYDDYLTGNVYGYSIGSENEDEHLDSCYGYYGELGKTQLILDAKCYIDSIKLE